MTAFGFLEQFDPEEPVERPKKDLKTAQELTEATADAHARGFEEGFTKGSQQAESEFATAALKLVGALSGATQALAEERTRHEAAFHGALSGIVKQIAGPISETAFPQAVAEAVAARLRDAAPSIVLRADPAWVEPLSEIAEQAQGAVEVRGDPSLSGLHAVIEWDQGLSKIDFEDAIARILDLLNVGEEPSQTMERAVNE